MGGGRHALVSPVADWMPCLHLSPGSCDGLPGLDCRGLEGKTLCRHRSSLPVNEIDRPHQLDETLGTRLRVEPIELAPRMGAAEPHWCATVPLPAFDN